MMPIQASTALIIEPAKIVFGEAAHIYSSAEESVYKLTCKTLAEKLPCTLSQPTIATVKNSGDNIKLWSWSNT